ncbi:MAG TPA: cyclic nucleotide-binding domain-containing protein, partial [Vampirovibrionales bacterium]
MTSTIDLSQISEFLKKTAPFDRLSDRALENLATHCELLRYRTGQPIFELGKMPTQVAVIYEGQVRELAYDQRSQSMVSLRLAGPGEILGWGSLVRGVAVDSAIASREVICVCIRASTFLEQVKSEKVFREAFEQQAALNEVFELLSGELQRRADATTPAKDLTLQFQPQAVVINFPKGKANLTELDRHHLWFLSSGTIGDLDRGSRLIVDAQTIGKLPCPDGARVVGLPLFDLAGTQANPQDNGGAIADSHSAIAPTTPLTPTVVDPIPYAPDRPPV